jgi:hypothetical protein
MMIPGANLFNLATRVIGTQPIGYEQHQSRAQNGVGQWITTFNTPIVLAASVQAVDRSKYIEWGLSLEKKYMMLYLAADVFDLDRDLTPDQFLFDGCKWQIEGEADWYARDGWTRVLVVKQGSATMPPGVK